MIRILIFKYTLIALLIVLLGGLFFTQILNGEYYADLSENNRIRLQPIKAPRGQILDQSGNVLAGNRPSYNIYIVPQDFDKTYSSWLEKVLNLEEGSLKEILSPRKTNPYLPYLLKADVSKENVFRIQEKKPDLTGVMMTVEGRRFYPGGATSGHLTGYIGKVSRKEYEEGQGKYGLNDFVGRAGIEKQFTDLLRGEDGGRQVEVNSRGEVIRVLGERRPKPGQDISLSVDAELQGIIWDVVKDYENNLSIGILDLRTNEIVALINKPSYDPNVFVSGGKNKERVALLKDKKHPMLNRLVSAGFPPGSVFKLITATAGLESGKITEHSVFFCNSTFRLGRSKHVFHCWNEYGHGDVDLYKAIVQSCNVYFYRLGRILGEKLIAKTARIFNLDKEPPIELPAVFGGLVPDDEWKRKRLGDRWYQGETISYSIGQSYLLLSPLQVLVMVATFAKDGFLPQVTVLKGRGGTDRKISVKEKNIKSVKQGMRGVVEDIEGTGKYAQVPFMELGAKTGTAQTPRGKAHAWFAGFFPYTNPHYAMVCMIEHGGGGGMVAGTLTREILEAWQKRKGIELA